MTVVGAVVDVFKSLLSPLARRKKPAEPLAAGRRQPPAVQPPAVTTPAEAPPTMAAWQKPPGTPQIPPSPPARPPAMAPAEQQLYDQIGAQIPGFGGVIKAGDTFVNGLPVPDIVKSFMKNPLLGQFELAKDAFNSIFGGGSHHPSANSTPLSSLPPAGTCIRRDSVDTDSVYFFDGRARHNMVPRSVIDDLGLPVLAVQRATLEAVPETWTVTSAAGCKLCLDPSYSPPPPPSPVPADEQPRPAPQPGRRTYTD